MAIDDEYIRLDDKGYPLPRETDTTKSAPAFTPKVKPPSYLGLKLKTESGRSIKIALLVLGILSAILLFMLIGLIIQKYFW